MNINKTKILDNFKKINNLIIFKFLVCYKKLLNKEGISRNIGAYLLFSIIIFHIITIFIICLKQPSSLIKKIEKIASEKREFLSTEKNNKKEKKILPTINQPVFQLIFLFKNSYKKRIPNIKNEQKDSKSKIKRKSKIVQKNSKENIDNYIDEEINSFSYDLSLKLDKRTYCQYYISLLKTKHSLICALFNKNDYNSGIIKINLFFIGLTIEYIVNALFYNDDTMHKIYENKGQFDLETQLPIALYSTIISTLLNDPLNFLALSNKAIINFKKDKKANVTEKEKKLKKRWLLNLFCILFLVLFFYYFFGIIFLYMVLYIKILKCIY